MSGYLRFRTSRRERNDLCGTPLDQPAERTARQSHAHTASRYTVERALPGARVGVRGTRGIADDLVDELEIAEKTPVTKTMKRGTTIVTHVVTA